MKEAAAIVLAAGLGKRMKSSLPKVAHPAAGRPLVWHVAHAARAAGIKEIVFVLGPARDALERELAPFGGRVAVQPSPRGTGDAARCGLEALPPGIREVAVLCGDAPLLRPATIRALFAARRRRGAAAAVLTGILEDPRGYGRIVRGPSGEVVRIVEERDADAAARAIREVNSGGYVFDRAFLAEVLPRLSDRNAQKEFYLTDAVAEALARGRPVVAVPAADPDEVRGVNSRKELAEAAAVLVRRRIEALMEAGVTFVDPQRTYVEAGVRAGRDTVIGPGVALLGTTRVGRGARIDQGCVVEDSVVGDGVHLRPYAVLTGARVRRGAVVGPFSHLRPGADIGEEAHIGNFVEVKKSRVGKGSKANHLAYIGDAVVGRKVNIGAGTITCNYDGLAKHTTVIGDGVFVGSDTQFVAPVRVGRGALVGAGATITRDVPPYALALSRVEQKNLAFWVARKRPALLAKAGLAVPRVPERRGRGEGGS